MTDLTFYKYKVQWYDTENAITNDLCGITVGESYSDAFARVLDYYGGEREVESLYIEAWDVSQCLEMRPEVLRCVEYDETEIIIDYTVNPDLIPDPAAISEVAIPYNDPTPLENKAPSAKAYVDGHPEVCYYGPSIDSIIQTNWFDRVSCEYGLANIIFEEEDK